MANAFRLASALGPRGLFCKQLVPPLGLAGIQNTQQGCSGALSIASGQNGSEWVLLDKYRLNLQGNKWLQMEFVGNSN